MDRERERMKRLFANGRGLRIIPAIMVVFTGLVVAGLTSWSRSQNDALAENAYAQLPLGALTRIEMIRYITEQGGEAITTNHADNLYRMRMGDDYLVLVCGAKGTIDATAVYSETGDLLDTNGIDPIAFDCEYVPQTYAELCERYGAPHGERGSGLYYACYLTDEAQIVAFRMEPSAESYFVGDDDTGEQQDELVIRSIYVENIATMEDNRQYILEP